MNFSRKRVTWVVSAVCQEVEADGRLSDASDYQALLVLASFDPLMLWLQPAFRAG
jgi:hypothetical protein